MTTRHDSAACKSKDVDALQLRGWRFPLSRYHLWDRHAMGERITVTPTLLLPETVMTSHGLETLQRADDVETVALGVIWSSGENGGQELKIDCPDASGHIENALICLCRDENNTNVRKPEIERLTRRYEEFCSDLEISPGNANLFPMTLTRHRLRSSGEMVVEGYMGCPDHSLQLSPIRMKNVLDTPLATTLKAGMRNNKPPCPQVGYLSMDTCRRLIPLLPDDSNVGSMTLVGIWVSGLSSILHPTVVAACLRFHHSSSIQDRATLDGAFLMLFYGWEEYSAKLYECKIDDGMTNYKQVLYSCRILGRKTVGCRDVKIKWKLESISQPKQTLQHSRERPASPRRINGSQESVPPKNQGSHLGENLLEDVAFSFSTRMRSRIQRDEKSEEMFSNKIESSCTNEGQVLQMADAVEISAVENRTCVQPCIGEHQHIQTSEDSQGTTGHLIGREERKGSSNSAPVRSPILKSRQTSERDMLEEPGSVFLGFNVVESGRSSSATPIHQTPRSKSKRECNSEDGSPECMQTPHVPSPSASRQLELERHVHDLQEKVAVLERHIQELRVGALGEGGLPMTSPVSSTDRERDVAGDALALVPISEIQDTTSTLRPKRNAGGHAHVAETPGPVYGSCFAWNSMEASCISQSNSLDLASILSYPYLDLSESTVDVPDPELERISRKYLGEGIKP